MIQDLYLVRGIKRALGLHMPGRMLDVFPDDTFLVSYPKSGSTWVRFLVANLRSPDKNPDFTNINDLFTDFQAFSKRALLRLPRPRTMKSHLYFDSRYRKVLYIVRDPRDVVLAEYHFGIKQRLHDETYPLADYIPRFLAGNTGHAYGSWFEHLASWYFSRRNDPHFCWLGTSRCMRRLQSSLPGLPISWEFRAILPGSPLPSNKAMPSACVPWKRNKPMFSPQPGRRGSTCPTSG